MIKSTEMKKERKKLGEHINTDSKAVFGLKILCCHFNDQESPKQTVMEINLVKSSSLLGCRNVTQKCGNNSAEEV